MSLTDLERIADEMERQLGSFEDAVRCGCCNQHGRWANEWASHLRAWIAREREFIEASEEYCAKNPVWGYPRLMVAYRAREERKKGAT